MASEQQASIDGSGNIIIQSSGDYAHITIGVPYLTLSRIFGRNIGELLELRGRQAVFFKRNQIHCSFLL